MIFNNKSKYNVLVLNVRNSEESEKLQRLANSYGIYWSGHSRDFIYDFNGRNRHIYLVLNHEEGCEPRMLWSDRFDYNFMDGRSWDKVVYTVDQYHEVHVFLKNSGLPVPNYKPRKIDRSI